MPKEAPEIRLIRETLEGVLHPTAAASLFFTALETYGGTLPDSPAEALDFVEEALTPELNGTLDEEDVRGVLRKLRRILGASGKDRRSSSRSRHKMVTTAVDVREEPLTVFVLSSGGQLANMLRAALGPAVMSAVEVGDETTLESSLQRLSPGLILVDGWSAPKLSANQLVTRTAPLPRQTLRAIWGGELPYGQQVLSASERLGIEFIPVGRNDGVAPLVDLIRSRRA